MTIFNQINSLQAELFSVQYILLTIASLTLISSYFYYKKAFKFWHDRGLKNPPPLPIFGNITSFFRSQFEYELELVEKYGKLYGIYFGTDPRLKVADAEVLRQICIKDFQKFPNHNAHEWLNDIQRHWIFFTQDEYWKKLRAMQTPTFTSGKIKRMFKMLHLCCDDIVECVKEQLNKSEPNVSIFNAQEVYSLFTMDAIASCAFSLKLHREGSSDIKSASSRDAFVAAAYKLFDFNKFKMLIPLVAPKFILRSLDFANSSLERMEPLRQRVAALVNQRRATGKKHDDYLQLLLDAKFKDEIELNDMDAKENHHAGLTKEMIFADQNQLIADVESKAKEDGQNSASLCGSLSDMEVVASAMFLFAVGLETTATSLTNLTYYLAFHQEIQQRLYEEVKSIAELNETKTGYVFGYDELTSLPYMDAVLSETLRVCPPVLMLDRVASQDYLIEKYNVNIPKGLKIALCYHAIMHNPEYWPEPDKYDPERFMPGNKEKIVPGSYCPFGLGPRHCLGMRFSLTETKLAIAKILMEFRFEPVEGTQMPPKTKVLFALSHIADSRVKAISRNTPDA